MTGRRGNPGVAMLAVLMLALSGCSASDNPATVSSPPPPPLPAPVSPPAPVVGMPNPASVHCDNLGGRLETRTDATGGAYGMCHLPDGRVCEEWALFRDRQCVDPRP